MGECRPAGIRCGKAFGQFVETSACLAKAAIQLDGAAVFGRVKVPLVHHSRDLFEGALRQCRHLENAPALGAGAGDQRRVACLLIEMIQDGCAVDQHFAIVEDEGRDAGQRADPPDCCRIAKDGSRICRECQRTYKRVQRAAKKGATQ